MFLEDVDVHGAAACGAALQLELTPHLSKNLRGADTEASLSRYAD